MRVAMASILARTGWSSSYRKRKGPAPASAEAASARASSQALTTASPSATQPLPPSDQCVHSTASAAPASSALRRSSSTSASVSVKNRLMATTGRTPNPRTLDTCLARFAHPASSSGMFSVLYSSARGWPGTTGGPPPCVLRARTVATMTQAPGRRPERRHLMLKNFSAPMSAPNPASVTTTPSFPARRRVIWSAMMLELPCAMLANGPACTITGLPSRLCMSVGLMASRISTASAPPQPRSSAVTGRPARERATTMLPRRSRMSRRLVARASTAITSDATVMSKPVSRGTPLTSLGPVPTVMPRRWRSQVSTTRRQVMVAGSISRRANRAWSSGESSAGAGQSAGSVVPSGTMPSLTSRRTCTGANPRVLSLNVVRRSNRRASRCVPSWKMRVSMAAASRLLAAVMAWMSPVPCRLKASIGTTWA
mmetsp:Transcript_16838/g.63854  ORF Transcript_16838/g.63854 Transcript_16838/m.63854 type:complete len:426 (+) Transcript_16838:562-1839(+)